MADPIEVQVTVWQDGERLDSESFYDTPLDAVMRAGQWLQNFYQNGEFK